MGKYLMMAAVALGGLGIVSEAKAGVAVRVGPVAVAAGGRPYYATRGVPYRGGYYYAGRDHRHWAHRSWDAGLRRYHYYDPYLRAYYYYCPERRGYYPVAVAAPAPVIIRVR